VRNFEQNLARQRLSLDQYLKLTDKTREGLADELRPTAERNLKNYLVLREVAQAETVAITDEEIEAEIDRVASSMSDEGEAARVREMLSSQAQRDDLQASIWERKVTQLLIGIAQQPPEAAGTAVDATDTAPADDEQAGDEAAEKPKRSRAKKPTQKD
jgi:trigger factor